MSRRRSGGRRGRGMTLMETLLATLILALLSAVVLSGSRASVSSYEEGTFAAESGNVSALINTALSDVLRYAASVTVDDAGAVTAYSAPEYGITDGRVCVGSQESDRGRIYLKYDPQDGKKSAALLSDLSYAGLSVVSADNTYQLNADGSAVFALTYADGVFTGSYRLCNPSSGQLSDPITFHYRSVNSVAATPAGG